MNITGNESGSGSAGDIKTYSLEEVAAMVLPPELKDGCRWLARRLNGGEIRGYKVGRIWRMTEADVHDLLSRYSNDSSVSASRQETPADYPDNPMLAALSPRSRARLMNPGKKPGPKPRQRPPWPTA